MNQYLQRKFGFMCVIRTSLCIIIPFAYLVNIYVFLGVVVLYCFSFLFENGPTMSKIFVVYLLSFQFSGLRIAGVHFYDIILLFVIVTVIIRNKGVIRVQHGPEIFAFILFIFLALFQSMSAIALNNAIAFVTAIITYITVLNIDIDKEYCRQKAEGLAISSVYFSLAVFVLYSRGMITNVTSGTVTSDIFLYTDEMRMNGFFTDPNKYLTYEMALICLLVLMQSRKVIIILTIIGTVISMSRSSLICIVIYIFFILYKVINRHLDRSSKVLFTILLSVLTVGAIYFASSSNISNVLFSVAGRFLGRTRSVEYTATIADDNRIKIWKMAIEYIEKRPLLGYGLDVLDNKNILPYGTHNTFLGLMLKGGVFLPICFFVFFRDFLTHLNAEIIAFLLLPLFFLDLDSYRVLYLMYAVYILSWNKVPDKKFGKKIG